jgi:Na+/proline symporter
MNVIARDKVSKQSQPACGGLFLTFSDCFVPPEADHGGLLAKTTEGTFSTPPLSLFLDWKQFGWFGLYEIVPGFILSFVAIIMVSLLDKEPSREILQDFEQSRPCEH